MMEKPAAYGILRPATSSVVVVIVLILGLVALSCCVAAEFEKAKEEDMKLDGNLCSMPRTPAFGLGITALLCLSVAQILGTSAVAIRLRRRKGSSLSAGPERRTALAITMLALSWVGYGVATVMLGTGSSMNKGQPYGQGWMDGRCYVVRPGVYLASAALVALAAALLLAACFLLLFFTSFAAARGRGARLHRRTGPDELPHTSADTPSHCDAATTN